MRMKFAKLADPEGFYLNAMHCADKFMTTNSDDVRPDLWTPTGVHIVTCKPGGADKWVVAATPETLSYDYNGPLGAIMIEIHIFDSYNGGKNINYHEYFSENLNGSINKELWRHVSLMREFYETLKDGDDIVC